MIMAGWCGDVIAGSRKEGKMEFVIGVLVIVILVIVIMRFI
jgi:hypothetical protein